ncbi:MAG: aminotransferase class I/II-fold pyridoxal phosphate-dependent enzyme [Lachnospiraceae bacterium]|nr:aminotransferase class I/II-fold pyridoxal phosphate-dependent enzyme [Lachnospiraceae bacterium]
MSWENNIRRVEPYVPGEQPRSESRIIKLNTNEFPYPPSPKVRAVADDLNIESLRLYPDTTAEPLTSELAARYGVDNSQVFVGVGSDDVLSIAFLTCFNSEKPVLFPDITYSFYDVWADVYRIPYRTVPLDEDFHIKKEDYYGNIGSTGDKSDISEQESSCNKGGNGGIVIANPNAPTGISEARDISFFEDIVKNNPDSVVIFDEAYVDFGGVSALPLINKYENVLIVRTFSKSRAFAGMRIGFAIGSRKLIKYMNDVRFSINSYTMNRASVEFGRAVLADEDYYNEMVGKVIATRERIKKELKDLSFYCTDSKTNFLFCSHPDVKASEIFRRLRDNGIFVRFFDKQRIDNYLRITVGTDGEMDRLMSELRKIINKKSSVSG